MKIERKAFNAASFKATDAAQGIAEMIVSIFNNVDSGNEVVLPGFFAESIAARRAADGRPKAKGVWGHDWLTPIAKTLDAQELLPGDPRLPTDTQTLGGLWVKAQFNLETQRGREAFSDMQGGYIDEFSIGYSVSQDKYQDGKRFLVKGDWYEWSPVLVGMNDATALLSTKTASDSKAAVPFKATDKAPEDEAWSAPALKDFTDKSWADLTDAEIAKITACFAWTVNMPPTAYGDLKIPHHNPDGAVVWLGVAAAAARLNQATIPAGDMPSVRGHLRGHYEQFGKDVPEVLKDGKAAKSADIARDFNATRAVAQAEEDTWKMRWELDDALRSAVASILSDDTLDPASKLAMVRTSVAQYGEALAGWAERVLALAAAGVDVELDAANSSEHKGQPYAEQAEAALAAAKALVGRSVALAATRQKEGRTLSTANRDRLGSLKESLAAVLADIDDLLTATEPPKQLSTDYLERRLRASALSLAIRN